eukprot:CAMPEP_0185719548 /NCGR_PEP_ID=MMETSP1164-20130828/48968_1 /TAXON_ID=1104430 /ORGANISM="Chrysoreinhardia sp, Strain CCMP2950" /LENGTH=370 /DNA_ID=CAMNT_0028387209 /DNA_START=190 /DNA_END=1299 /DNA_ORIENTATION=-
MATPNHDMYLECVVPRAQVQVTCDLKHAVNLRKVRAEHVLDLRDDTLLRMRSCATQGYCVPSDECIHGLCNALGLDNEGKMIAFCELYGSWLGLGSLDFNRCPGGSVLFRTSREHHVDYVSERLSMCEVEFDIDNLYGNDQGTVCVVTDPEWVNFFCGEHEDIQRASPRLGRISRRVAKVIAMIGPLDVLARDRLPQNAALQRASINLEWMAQFNHVIHPFDDYASTEVSSLNRVRLPRLSSGRRCCTTHDAFQPSHAMPDMQSLVVAKSELEQTCKLVDTQEMPFPSLSLIGSVVQLLHDEVHGCRRAASLVPPFLFSLCGKVLGQAHGHLKTKNRETIIKALVGAGPTLSRAQKQVNSHHSLVKPRRT